MARQANKNGAPIDAPFLYAWIDLSKPGRAYRLRTADTDVYCYFSTSPRTFQVTSGPQLNECQASTWECPLRISDFGFRIERPEGLQSAIRIPQSETGPFLRKEVIQPHLPIRLPCYDFVPLAPHTFDRSLPCGLSHGLRVQTTQVT